MLSLGGGQEVTVARLRLDELVATGLARGHVLVAAFLGEVMTLAASAVHAPPRRRRTLRLRMQPRLLLCGPGGLLSAAFVCSRALVSFCLGVGNLGVEGRSASTAPR